MFRKINNIVNKIKIRLFNYKKGNKLKVIITGPPRSGTSFLCGLIVRMGFDPGPENWLKKGDQNNPYGYYECMPLMAIDHGLLGKLGGSVMDPPDLSGNWLDLCDDEKKQIREIVEKGGIEIYKGNMLIVIADLYGRLFSDAKWIMIHRGEEGTIRSMRMAGNDRSYQEMSEILKIRMQCWNKNYASRNCLTIKYEDFFSDPNGMVETIANYLDVKLSEDSFKECVDFFKPRSA